MKHTSLLIGRIVHAPTSNSHQMDLNYIGKGFIKLQFCIINKKYTPSIHSTKGLCSSYKCDLIQCMQFGLQNCSRSYYFYKFMMLSKSFIGDDIIDDIPKTKRSVRSCKGHPNVLQCIRAYFSNRFRLMHRAVKDPVDLRNIGKRANSYSDSDEKAQPRLDQLNSLYDGLIKKAASDFRSIGKKSAAADFRSIGRRSLGADFRNIGKRFYAADWRNIGKRLPADFRNIGKRGYATDFRSMGKRGFNADFRNIGKRSYAADFRSIGKRLGVEFRNIGKRMASIKDNDMDFRALTSLCPDPTTLVECADSIAANTYI